MTKFGRKQNSDSCITAMLVRFWLILYVSMSHMTEDSIKLCMFDVCRASDPDLSSIGDDRDILKHRVHCTQTVFMGDAFSLS